MRVLRCLPLLLAAACAGSPAGRADELLPAETLPFAASRAVFRDSRGASLHLAMEPAPGLDHAVMTVTGDDIPDRRIDLVRDGAAIRFRTGPDAGTELLRVGARPGDTWASGPDTVTFDGWQRVEVPAGTFDAVRVTAERGPEDFRRVETWWFSPGVGLVRMRSDHGGVFAEEIWLVEIETP